MAYASRRLGYQHPRTDNNQSGFDEDDLAVLDPAVLDADIMQSPSSSNFRKDSFANSNGVLSPADSQAWDQHQFGGLPIEHAAAGAAHPYHDENNGFVRQGAPHPHAPYGHPTQHPSWAFDQESGNCTPSTGLEMMPPPPQFQTPQYAHQRVDGSHAGFIHPHPPPGFGTVHVEGGFMPAPQVQTPMSPHSHQDWMGLAQQELDNRPLPKRMRPNSPPMTMVDYARRDGIRKKNGRIDIPQERNIHTIDELIDKTTDEDLLKELKQQKRLLRNREAALASRQRKKKHTEDLEVKEKGYTHQIVLLERDLTDLTVEHQRCNEERQVLIHRFQESQRAIENLQEQIREMTIKHNDETSNLRKRVNILTEQLEAGMAPAMSAAPSSTGFTDFNAEMEALNMGPHDWDNFIFVNELQNDSPDDFTFDSRPEPVKQSPATEKRPAPSNAVQTASKKDVTADQPIASGLLFMLLLCGAFVASKPASSRPPDLPEMPPNVRAVAPAVLNSLLSDAGPSTQTTSHGINHMHRIPGPSAVPHAGPRTSRLDRMHSRLTTASKQQEIDQVFALTPAQYASISNMNYPGYDERQGQSNTVARPRRNLAEALANMQQEHQQSSKAEVYTRSLLWDQIPADVVKQFKEIVRDHAEIEARQQQHGYKTEA